ncbi:MAG TPA: hypothetical protein VGX92_17975 [Pyrinomonadaceae bacterium]|jgi:hypothetical protein|nr:hypothetical protein [Pyrinomonadaceae bacterium]
MRYAASLCLALFLFIICADPGFAQEKCTLTSAGTPEFEGLRLGMTTDQVKARFRVIETEAADDYGVTLLRLDPGRDTFEAESIRDIAIELIGAKVAAIRLVYNPAAAPGNHQSFAEGLSKSLKLPQGWKAVTVGQMVTGMVMACADFKISANLIGGRIPVVYLSALEAELTLSKRRLEKEKRLREFFKP